MPINTFDVTPDTIKAQVTNLSLTATSSPSTSDVEGMILAAASRVSAEAAAVEIDAESYTDPAVATYHVLRDMVVYDVLDRIMTARERGTEGAGKVYRERYALLLETLRKRSQAVVVNDEAVGAPYYVGLDSTDDLAWNTTAAGRAARGGY